MIYTIFAADPSPADLGTAIISFAFILLIVERIASLVRFFWPHQPVAQAVAVKPNGDYATRADISRLEKQLGDLTTDYKDLLKSTFDRYDGFNKTVADLRVGQEELRREIHDEVSKLGIILVAKIDAATKAAIESHQHARGE
jgi:hypothetical protein